MCRLLVYKGNEPIQLSHLVTRPRHSITNQAFESKLRFPSSRPMNADGFGIGWYDPQPPTYNIHAPHQPHPTASPAPPTQSRPSSPPLGGKHPHQSSPLDLCEPVAALDGNRDTDHEVAQRELLAKRDAEQALANERPCLFKSLSPAWSNANLGRLAEKLRSPLVFAHVRASTQAGAPSEDNAHPWMFDRLMWMHNGEISNFSKIKRALQQSLPEELFLYPSGYTDSEWAFMVFLSKLKDPHSRSFTHIELRNAMMETIKHINKLSKDAGITSPHLLNYVVTDGESIVATRYISSRVFEASSLFFSSGTEFKEYEEGGIYRMIKADKRENVIMIASEPLTYERSDWMEVKTNTMIVITPKMNVLQVPIIDEFWVAPQDPEAHARTQDFAIAKGFGHGFASMEASQEVIAH